MRILWFPRLQIDIARLHHITWRNMYDELSKSGHEVQIAICGDYGEFARDANIIYIPLIKVKYLRLLSFWSIGYVKFIFSFIASKPDVVIFDIFSMWFSLPFVFFFGNKRSFILDNRTPFFGIDDDKSLGLKSRLMKRYTDLCMRFAQRRFSGITVITDFYKNLIVRNYSIPPKKVGVWTSGVDLSIFSPPDYNQAFSITRKKDKLVLVQHGEISFNRGIIETIQGIRLVNDLRVEMLLIGHGKAKEEISKLVSSLGLKRQVTILPPVPQKDIPKLIASADCGILAYPPLSYWNCNSPLKLLEYLAMGKYLICTKIWTFETVISNSRCGFLIENNAPSSIADAIRFCLENKDKLAEWGREGADIVRSKFTWQIQARKFEIFLESIRK